MRRYTAAALLLVIASVAHASRVEAQTNAAYETSEAQALRLKLEEIERLAQVEFDRSRETGERRAARARFEVANGLRFAVPSAEDQAILAPPQGDAARFAALLAQPDTGLVRLLPRERATGRASVREGGSFYSFTHLVHEYNYGSDIMLEQNRLTAFTTGASIGFLFDLGEMELEEVTTSTGPVGFLATFTPPKTVPEAHKLKMQIYEGYQHEWFVYRKQIPATVGHTYVLRSVDYDVSDLLVAFRVLRRDENGDLILLWRMLKRFPVPRLERATGR